MVFIHSIPTSSSWNTCRWPPPKLMQRSNGTKQWNRYTHWNTFFAPLVDIYAYFAAEKIKYANENILFIITFMRIGADCPRTNWQRGTPLEGGGRVGTWRPDGQSADTSTAAIRKRWEGYRRLFVLRHQPEALFHIRGILQVSHIRSLEWQREFMARGTYWHRIVGTREDIQQHQRWLRHIRMPTFRQEDC